MLFRSDGRLCGGLRAGAVSGVGFLGGTELRLETSEGVRCWRDEWVFDGVRVADLRLDGAQPGSYFKKILL